MADTPTDLEATRAAERELHRRLLAGDPNASPDFIAAYLQPLVEALQRSSPRVDSHQVQSVAIDSVLNLAEHPERYNPDRGGLFAYLRMDARRDLLNALQPEQRRAARQTGLEGVEDRPRPRNISREDLEDPLDQLLRREAADSGRYLGLLAQLDPRERAGVELMMDGERRHEAFVPLLGLELRPRDEQAREVKRWKDRIVKRLRRLAARMDRDG